MLGLFTAGEARTEMAAPPDEVWRAISDPETYPDWLVGAQQIRGVDPRFPKPGSEFHHSVGPVEGATIDDSTMATKAEAPYRLDLDVRAGPFRAAVEMHVVPSQGGSEVRFSERATGPWAAVMPALRPFLHTRNAESLRRLSSFVEERAAEGHRRARTP